MTACNKNDDYSNLKKYEISGLATSGNLTEENHELSVGDKIICYEGDTKFFEKYFGCDTCKGVVEDIFFSKPTGEIAFIEFEDNQSKNNKYAISLYYWDSERGYNTSNIQVWKRKMTNDEKDLLRSDFISKVDHHNVDKNIKFKISN